VRERQLAFDLGARDAFGRGDFFVSDANAVAVAAVDDWRRWPAGRLLVLGDEAAGKTHLARLWSAETGAAVVMADALDADVPAGLPEGPLVVEDVHLAAGRPEAEEALFHLVNLQAERAAPFLMTGRGRPADWGIRLPDLLSRLQGTAAITLGAPDDALLAAVLVKLFADRQLNPTPAVIDYLVRRMPRSFRAARDIVLAMDRRSLSEKRDITRHLAAEVLATLDRGSEAET